MPLITGLDLETTGIDKKSGGAGEHRVIEVSAQFYDLTSRRKVKAYVQRIDPQRAIAPDAQRVHKIAGADLIGCPTWDVVGPKVHKILAASSLVVAHNGLGFDRPFLKDELARLGLALPDTPWFDTMLEGRWASPVGAVPNLGALCWACDVPYDTEQAHGADYDVDVMMSCFFRGLDWGFYQLPAGLLPEPMIEEAA
ncbi:hypothetical protein [Azospirillum argentinense]|uniref:3'-5' exonuclease n=1 Tax=Azospirillum argentinense TaxID=2970906 RepID=UPI0032DF588F